MTNEEVQYIRQVLLDSKEELPTVALQLESLRRFMDAVGYDMVGSDGQNFVLRDKEKPYPIDMNWKKAVALHNNCFFVKGRDRYNIGEHGRFYAATNVHILKEEQRVKIVQDVFLIWQKSKRCWITQRNQVKLVNLED